MYLYSRNSNRNPESQAKAVPVQSFLILSDVMNRLGNRGDRVSDFSLQKLCFSALCGPN